MTVIEERLYTAAIDYFRNSKKPGEPDWEQRKYELVRDYLQRVAEDPSMNSDTLNEQQIDDAIKWAELVIKKLKTL